MKTLHLLCNAHIDPVWLWLRKDGIAETLSTFRIAADFCEKFDGFVFNHNEALLYEWVEEYEPQLFERIRRLVKEGKWAIMGGWYLQPDCVMTSGESLFSQIELGRDYFKEKFGVEPTTAIGFDAFGHSRGLVQILKQTGYDSYLFVRPQTYFSGDFIWEGFDGSRVFAHGISGGGYASLKGDALNKANRYLENHGNKEIGLCLWGIGNHGGGPSRVDLEGLNRLIGEADIEILHSTAEAYVADIDQNDLPVIRQSLVPSMVGCYTSMTLIKQANRRLENSMAVTEKIMSYAKMISDVDFDEGELIQAKKALAFCQFHDVLPGSSIKAVEEESLRYFHYGEEILDRLWTKAFFKLCDGQRVAKEGEIPVMAFNPHPYPVEGDFAVDFILQNQNWNEDEYTVATVYDEKGNPLPSQNEKADATFHLDWPKKVSFHAILAPSSVNRFDCRLTVRKTAELKKPVYEDPEHFSFQNERMRVAIGKKTGLIEYYEVDGKRLLTNGGALEVYRDNEDPWGMTVESFRCREGRFALMDKDEVNRRLGYPEESAPAVRIVEDGAVRTKIQAFFTYGNSTAMVEYTIPRQGAHVDVELTINSQEPNRMLKYCFDTDFSGTPMGDTAFGVEQLYEDERESVYQKWCGIVGAEERLYILNRGTYGGSFTDHSIKLSLLRTAVYAAHPIKQRQIVPHYRALDRIDMGERSFSFRITAEKEIAALAQVYNETPQILSVFPSGEGERHSSLICIDNASVLLSTVKRKKRGFTLRLYNSLDVPTEATVALPALGRALTHSFGAYEIKTVDIGDPV